MKYILAGKCDTSFLIVDRSSPVPTDVISIYFNSSDDCQSSDEWISDIICNPKTSFLIVDRSSPVPTDIILI